MGNSHGTHFHISGFCFCLLKQSVCCWDIYHADKPEANTGIIRHLMCCGETPFSALTARLASSCFFVFFFVIPCNTLSSNANGVPDQQTSTNVSQAVKYVFVMEVFLFFAQTSASPLKLLFQDELWGLILHTHKHTRTLFPARFPSGSMWLNLQSNPPPVLPCLLLSTFGAGHREKLSCVWQCSLSPTLEKKILFKALSWAVSDGCLIASLWIISSLSVYLPRCSF